MTQAFFFGYGSLVNRLTHGYAPAHRARASGWRRAWIATAQRRVAYLTAVPDPDCAIDGLIAPVPPEGWATLDLREAAYERLTATDRIEHEATDAQTIAIYEIAPENRLPPSPDHPVLLSYIDVVVQGYLTEYGSEGAAHFFATTTGWEAPILNDRAAPRYPRAQRLTDAERVVVDHGLSRLGCRLFTEA
ncbi:gamma-glutamylcyclotransferase family protein [Thetidibacter halocola]|uniref:Gamma-glutamylcyclotransferase n=1 Tax=Thetidibacter halocola TaxID=2827239 RepID=A0A8J8B8P4_9RHOB|nr:gamma-glutamylcyclotransferase family protein [Thetidibacter halocola]MBS0123363.1 gamma-glutamylcyclotransferase [Thetidibacter halocola]